MTVHRDTTSPKRATVLYLVSHPIQYQAPLLRFVAARASFDLIVGCTSNNNISRCDDGFGQEIAYDVPLLDGYRSFRATPLPLLRALKEADVVWLHGWRGPKHLAVVLLGRLGLVRVLIRCDTWSGAYPATTVWRARARTWLHRFVIRSCSASLAIGQRNRTWLTSMGLRD